MNNIPDMLYRIIPVYTAIAGGLLVLVGIMECLWPVKAFAFWKNWASHRAYFLHGLILIIGGFPLTQYKGPFGIAIFIIGCISVITGPVVLLYPRKIQSMFESLEKEMEGVSIHKVMVTEGVVRVSVGIICILGYVMLQVQG